MLEGSSDAANKFHLEHSEVVFVSIQECDKALERVYGRMQECQTGGPEHHVIVNCGVAAHRPGFDLENIGRNIANFCIPDEGMN